MVISKSKISHESPRSRLRRPQENLSLHPLRIELLTFKATERGNTGSFKFRRKNVGWSKKIHREQIQHLQWFWSAPPAQRRCPQKARIPHAQPGAQVGPGPEQRPETWWCCPCSVPVSEGDNGSSEGCGVRSLSRLRDPNHQDPISQRAWSCSGASPQPNPTDLLGQAEL